MLIIGVLFIVLSPVCVCVEQFWILAMVLMYSGSSVSVIVLVSISGIYYYAMTLQYVNVYWSMVSNDNLCSSEPVLLIYICV